MTKATLLFSGDDAASLPAHDVALSPDDNLTDIIRTKNITHVYAIAHSASRVALAQLGAQLDVQPITDIVRIIDDETFVRPVYAGNALMALRSDDPVKLVSLRAGRSASGPKSKTLRHADIVVGGGRAFGSKDNFVQVERLADTMDAGIGATRAAVDAGYIGNEHQIGQTGQVIAPALYLALGISGALQHVGGIRGAKTVIAVNTDANAPIFRHATYGFVGDVFEVVPELIRRFTSKST